MWCITNLRKRQSISESEPSVFSTLHQCKYPCKTLCMSMKIAWHANSTNGACLLFSVKCDSFQYSGTRSLYTVNALYNGSSWYSRKGSDYALSKTMAQGISRGPMLLNNQCFEGQFAFSRYKISIVRVQGWCNISMHFSLFCNYSPEVVLLQKLSF